MIALQHKLRAVPGQGFDHEIVDDAASHYWPIARIYNDSNLDTWPLCTLFAGSLNLLAAAEAALAWFVDPNAGDEPQIVIEQLTAAIAAIKDDHRR